MMGYDLLLGTVIFAPFGLLLVRHADRLAAWYSRLWFAKWYESWWGFDENWARSCYIIMGRLYVAIAVCLFVCFIFVNVRRSILGT